MIALTMRLTSGVKRIMTVAYAPGTDAKHPMIRLTSNELLSNAGFRVGDKYSVEYGKGIITITKHN